MIVDFTVSNEGSLYLVTPHTLVGGDILTGRVPDDAQWYGRSLVVEHRYIKEFVDGLREDGYTVRP